jgi:hypothetical protein
VESTRAQTVPHGKDVVFNIETAQMELSAMGSSPRVGPQRAAKRRFAGAMHTTRPRNASHSVLFVFEEHYMFWLYANMGFFMFKVSIPALLHKNDSLHIFK